jgi:pimeloyl-ACP methyl ester carboxylesterase
VADHTRNGWHDLLPTIKPPAPVLAARKNSVFYRQGPTCVDQAIPNAETFLFEESAHTLFFDKPEKLDETAVRPVAGPAPLE